ncbi:8632_t:CDS:2 [Scutellospora calospora]|uniref:8632_t:CDS:1 n=1 Tax=Scutellospora calospora TaxID=85575 RepID=A0ACA9JUL9_9GLOM|nr:8632_t:CDS:2 [Scutellospora calospora]
MPFKVESVYNCYAALARYLHENSTIEGGVRIWDNETSKSDSLTSDKIISCLNNDYLSIDNNEGEDMYRLEYRDLKRRNNSGLQSRFHKEKNNQDEVLYQQHYSHTRTRFIPIPSNNINNQFTPVKDLLLYLSKCLLNCEATYNEDLESYYSFPEDSYVDYESEDNEETDVLVMAVPSTPNSSQNSTSPKLS